MNRWEKEVQQSLLDSEEAAIKELEKQYTRALNDINAKVKQFQTDIDLLDEALSQDGLDEAARAQLQSQRRSKVYQQQYQKALKGQVSAIVDKMHGDNYATIDKYLHGCYETGYIGTMYDITKQGIPIIAPIDQAAAVKAVLTDSKVSEGYYNHLGVSYAKLKKTITQEISRGIASSLPYSTIARNINNVSQSGLNNAKRITRTEGHRIQQTSTRDAQLAAKAKGADVVKQWDAALDGRTRDSHRRVDGEVRELDEKFSNGLMFPGDPSGPAAEVVNCRCTSDTRARWALDESELERLKERAEYFGLDKTESFEEYKKKYLTANTNLKSYNSNPYVINTGDLPPATYQYRDYDSYKAAVAEWKKTHDGNVHDYYVQNSVWDTSGLTDEQIERLKRFDATIAKLQADYPLRSDSLYIGSYDSVSMYLNDIQRSRMDGGFAQAQFWFNPDTNSAVIGFNPSGLTGSLADDLMTRERKIASGEVLSSVLDSSPEGMAIHEWGHGFTDFITKEMVYDNPTAQEYWSWYKTLSKDDIANGISAYATTNRGEFEAECFAELLTGNPRPIAVKFSEFLEQCVEDANKRVEMYGIDAVNSGVAGKLDHALNYAIKHDTSNIQTVILPKEEYAHVMSEIATNLSQVEKQMPVVSKAIGNYVYTFENNGFGDYRIIKKIGNNNEIEDIWSE